MILYSWKIQYILVEEQLDTPELGAYQSFGIMAIRRTSAGYQQLAYVSDISTDRAYAASLVSRCNRLGLSPVHLKDFILDTLGI